MYESGTQLISLETNPELRQRDGNEFNESLRIDGLDEVLYYREQHSQLDKPVKELSAFYTKLLVQVDAQKDETYKKILGLPIEILINKNPYNLKVGDPIRFKILFQGKPLFGAKVRIWNQYNNLTTTQNIFTLQDGTMETHISNAGTWLVSVVKMIPPKSSEADWQSFRGSLTFAIGE